MQFLININKRGKGKGTIIFYQHASTWIFLKTKFEISNSGCHKVPIFWPKINEASTPMIWGLLHEFLFLFRVSRVVSSIQSLATMPFLTTLTHFLFGLPPVFLAPSTYQITPPYLCMVLLLLIDATSNSHWCIHYWSHLKEIFWTTKTFIDPKNSQENISAPVVRGSTLSFDGFDLKGGGKRRRGGKYYIQLRIFHLKNSFSCKLCFVTCMYM